MHLGCLQGFWPELTVRMKLAVTEMEEAAGRRNHQVLSFEYTNFELPIRH